MKGIRTRKTGWKYILIYVLVSISCLVMFLFIAYFITKWMKRRDDKHYINKIKVKEASLKDSKINLVKKLNKIESKLSKDPENHKLIRKQTVYKNNINNINMCLDTTVSQEQAEANKPEQIETKTDKAINEIVETITN